jgi:RNA polymerase sigma-70 factor (sigma-E family)
VTLVLPLPPPGWFARLLRREASPIRLVSPPGGGPRAGDGQAGSAPAEPATIDDLYHARRLSLVRLAVLMVDDLPTAEDIVQDVFAALYRRHGKDLRDLGDPHAYLTAGVMNASRSALRRRRTARAYRPPEPGLSPAAEDLVMLRDGDRQMIECLRCLTVRQRQVLVLRYWSELTEQEIASVLNISCGTVKSTASRALTRLRELIGEES